MKREYGKMPISNTDRTFVESGQDTVHPLGNATFVEKNTTDTSTPLPSTDSGRPRRLGSGEITGTIGSGGMSDVYRIWDERLEIARAVKVLRPGFDQTLAQRFETEARITAKLHHPNIVEIHSVGEHEGVPYLEMEFVDGSSLDQHLVSTGRFPPDIACAISLLIARALEYAHNLEYLLYGQTYHGIIHRDLKPANVLVSRSGSVKLSDFGIARPTQAGLHTLDGGIVGTLQYLSPEQLDGINMDHRTDIYSLGCVLYELLTGIRTFPQDTLTGLMKAKAINSYRKPDTIVSEIPSRLARIIDTCLQAQPDRRYATAAHLVAELEKALRQLTPKTPELVMQHFVGQASPTTTLAPRRHRWLVGAVVILLAAGASALLIFQRRSLQVAARPVTSPAPQPRTTPEPAGENAEPLLAKDVISPIKTSEQTVLLSANRVSAPRPVQKTASRAKVVVRKQRNPKSRPAPARPAPDRLAATYGSSVPGEIARAALSRGNAADAVTALRRNTGTLTAQEKVLLAQALLETNDLKEAEMVVSGLPVLDGQTVLLTAAIQEKRGHPDLALSSYQQALVTPTTLGPPAEVRGLALYRTALLRETIYTQSPSAATRLQALNAWTAVKRLYESTPQHFRFKEANHKLAAFP